MKRLLPLILLFVVLISLAACGDSQFVQEQAGDNGQEQSPNNQETDPETASADNVKGVVYESYEAYDNAWRDFNRHINKQSGDHEIVSVHQSTVMPLDLKSFTYLLPLSFLGQSHSIAGTFDADMEAKMLQGAWAKDAELTYDEHEGYLLTGTNNEGNALEIRVKYDDKAESLRLDGYKDGAFEFLFEYSKTPDGYAAQYHCDAVVGMDKFDAIYGLCTYRLIFDGNNGSCARFDSVLSEPDSIYGGIFDKQSFIDGATHWLTITDGEFTGKLAGQEF